MKTYFAQLATSTTGTTVAIGWATAATVTLGTAMKAALIGTWYRRADCFWSSCIHLYN